MPSPLLSLDSRLWLIEQFLIPPLQLPLRESVKTLTLDTCWTPAKSTALLPAGAFTLRLPVLSW